MARIVANKTVYLNAEGKPVAEDSPDAATLLVRKGSAIDADRAKEYGVKGDEEAVYDAKADHEAKHGGETQAQADAARQRMMDGQSDPDGEAAPGERSGVKAQRSAPANKAKAAPEDDK